MADRPSKADVLRQLVEGTHVRNGSEKIGGIKPTAPATARPAAPQGSGGNGAQASQTPPPSDNK
jgi:hypothetical protein